MEQIFIISKEVKFNLSFDFCTFKLKMKPCISFLIQISEKNIL